MSNHSGNRRAILASLFHGLLVDQLIHKARWKPLEAGLAAVGSQAEDILECIEDEQDSGRQKPLDIEQLLATVIPSLLNQTRQ